TSHCAQLHHPPCPVVPSGVLRGLHIPSFTRNLVGVGYLQDRGITVPFVGGGRTVVCIDATTGVVLATFTQGVPLWSLRSPHRALPSCFLRSGRYVSQVPVSSPVAVSGQVAASCSYRSLAHPTILWHHRLGHLSLPRLRSMASHSLISGLPCVFPSLPPSLAPPCTPCDVWGPAPTLGPERECYFLVDVDDYSWCTTIFPLAKKSEVTSTLIRWLLATEGTRCSRVRCLHSNRGGAFCSGVLAGLWTGSPVVGSAFHVWGCLALVRDTSADKLWARAIPCVFLSFPSVSYYTRYPCRGLPVPPSPLFLTPSLPSAPAPPVPPPPSGPALSGASHATPLPSVAREVASPSTQSSSQSLQPPSALLRQVTMDSVGVGAGGAAANGIRSEGAHSRGTRARGASTGGVSFGGAGAGGTGTGGASFGGAGVGGADTEETGAGGSPIASPTGRPHRHDTRFQALRRLEREEQEWVEQERQELQQLDQQQQSSPWSSFLSSYPLPVTYCIRSYVSSSELDFGCFLSSSVTVVSSCCPARLDLSLSSACSALVSSCRPLHCLVSFSSSLFSACVYSPLSSHFITDYYRAARLVVSRVLASLVTDPRAPPSSISALTAAVADFASTRRLDYATCVVAALPPRPLSVEGESAFGCDVLEDGQFELEFLAAASPSLCAMLLSLEGDPDALGIPTPRTYCEAVLGKWASKWKAAMDAELASWRSTGTYVNAVPPPRANVVDGMWLFKVKRPPGSLTVFKARYVARGFSQHEGVDFFQTIALTPKMTTLRVLLHVAAQQDYELHSLDFSTAILQGRLHEEIWLRHPPGFTDTFPPGTQWSLRRPVYGLRQSPHEWHDTLRSTLRDIGFCPSSADPSLFVRTASTPFFILVYVDDLVFATVDRAALTEVKSELQKRHKCTDLGELQRYLGLQITKERAARTITLTQSHMVQHVLR
ncbi:unnamed protein product, partial [Closterium sp. NIES-53]